jgi:two-component system response regulator WspF
LRIAIVNDVCVVVEAMRRMIESAPGFEVCWTASDGREAVARCAVEIPDLILMDLLMPVMGGVEATRHIMKENPCPILVVTATIDGHFAQVYDAIGAGALDVVETPALDGMGGQQLLRKIATVRSLVDLGQRGRDGVNALPVSPDPDRRTAVARGLPVVAIGASTGGPKALSTVLAGLPADFPAAVLVVQHLDTRFTVGLADWLKRRTALEVWAMQRPQRICPGTVFIAACDAHMILDDRRWLDCVDGGSVTSEHRPSIDRLFESVASHAGIRGCGVLLTGMGRDGASGLLALRRAGFLTIVQDEASSVVWGMPGAAARLRAAGAVLPLEQIAPALVRYVRVLNRIDGEKPP